MKSFFKKISGFDKKNVVNDEDENFKEELGDEYYEEETDDDSFLDSTNNEEKK